jgi:hypothetical protein
MIFTMNMNKFKDVCMEQFRFLTKKLYNSLHRYKRFLNIFRRFKSFLSEKIHENTVNLFYGVFERFEQKQKILNVNSIYITLSLTV